MKKFLFILSTASILIVHLNSCSKPANPWSNLKPASGSGQNFTPVENCDTIHQHHRISIDSAAIYISDFWTNAGCEAFGAKYGAGVYFPFDYVSLANQPALQSYTGFSFFSGITDPWFGSGNLFMAVKLDEVCPGITNPLDNILPQDVFYSSEVYFEPLPNNQRLAPKVKEYLNNFQVSRKYLDDRLDTISKTALKKSSDLYKEKLQYDLNYANYGFGFFKMKDLENLYYQHELNSQTRQYDVQGLACFLGFDPKNKEEMIRIVVIPVLRDGSLLTVENTYCLEKSWPPIKKQ